MQEKITQPMLSLRVTEAVSIIFPVTVEVHLSVLSSLEHLQHSIEE